MMPRALLVAAALTAGTTASAQSLIVRSVGPSKARYPVGTKLADDAMLQLVEGDLVVLLDRFGTRQITKQRPVSLWTRREPGRIAYAPQDPAPSTAKGIRSSRAATRPPAQGIGSAGIAFALPIDTDRPGRWCISDRRAIRFLGPTAATLTATRLPAKSPVDLQASAAGRTWTHDLKPGATAELATSAGAFTLHALPETVWQGSGVEQATAFIDAGCDRSLDQLIAQQEQTGTWVVTGAAAK